MCGASVRPSCGRPAGCSAHGPTPQGRPATELDSATEPVLSTTPQPEGGWGVLRKWPRERPELSRRKNLAQIHESGRLQQLDRWSEIDLALVSADIIEA